MHIGVAITREVSASLGDCELTHQTRVPIDVGLARAQHCAYESALRDAGYVVERLPSTDQMPDSVFVEDIALVLDELAVVTRPGAPSRRAETPAVAEALAKYRPLVVIQEPGTVDGGDVLVVGQEVFVGLSTRTNDAAAGQLDSMLRPHGYHVHVIEVHGCLHLKSAVTRLCDDRLLVNPGWIDTQALGAFSLIEVDPGEPSAANALALDDRIMYPTSFPRTAERLEQCGFRVHRVDAGEVAKAEGAVTCCSLIVSGGQP
jgi:dimethylargininase